MALPTPNISNAAAYMLFAEAGRKASSVAGTANAIILSDPLLPPSPVEGYRIRFKAGGTNTGAVTVSATDDDANTWSAVALQDIDGNALIGGEMIQNHYYEITRNGSIWEITGAKSGVITGGGADATSVLNLGTGEGIFFQEAGDQIQLKSFVFGANMMFSSDNNEITATSKGGMHALNFVDDLGGQVATGAPAATANANALSAHEASGSSDKPVYFGPGIYEVDASVFKPTKATYFGPGKIRWRNDDFADGIDRELNAWPSFMYAPMSNVDSRPMIITSGHNAGVSLDPTVNGDMVLIGSETGTKLTGLTNPKPGNTPAPVSKNYVIAARGLEVATNVHHTEGLGTKFARWMDVGHRNSGVGSNVLEFAGMTNTSRIQASHPYFNLSTDNWINKRFEDKFPLVRNFLSDDHAYDATPTADNPHGVSDLGTVKSSILPEGEWEMTGNVHDGRDSGNKSFKSIDVAAHGYKTLTSGVDLERIAVQGKSALDHLMWGFQIAAQGGNVMANTISASQVTAQGTLALNDAASASRTIAVGTKSLRHIGLTDEDVHIEITEPVLGEGTSTIIDKVIAIGDFVGTTDRGDATAIPAALHILFNSIVIGFEAMGDYSNKNPTDTLFIGNHRSIPALGGNLVNNQIGVGITKEQIDAFGVNSTLPGMYVMQGTPPNAIEINDSQSAFVAIKDGNTGFLAIAGGTTSTSEGAYKISRGGIGSTSQFKHDYSNNITSLLASDPNNPKIQIAADTGVEIYDGVTNGAAAGNLFLQITSGGHIILPNLGTHDDEDAAKLAGVPQNGLYYGTGTNHTLRIQTQA